MFENIRLKFKLLKLNNSRNRTISLFRKDKRKMISEKKSRNDIRSIEEEEMFEVGLIDSEIEQCYTTYYLNKARKMFISIPSYSDKTFWKELDQNNPILYLSVSAIKMIRDEVKNNRKDNVNQLIQVITSLTGIIGAIIGVIAILNT